MNIVELFRRVPSHEFRAYLLAEREKSIEFLSSATEMFKVHRAQGRLSLLNEMLEALDKSKNLQ